MTACNAVPGLLDHIDAQAAQLAAYPADWREDSSLETWFPLTAEQLKAQTADIARLRDALVEIADYWNRDQNDQAMYDACWHAINTANAALAQEGA